MVIAPSFLKAFGEDRLDAVNFGGDGARRQAGDLTNRRRVHVFEIKQHHLRIGRPEGADHGHQPGKQLVLTGSLFGVGAIGDQL